MFKHYLAVTLLFVAATSASATALEAAQKTQNHTLNEANASQKRIDSSAAQAVSLQSEIEQLQSSNSSKIFCLLIGGIMK